MLMQALIHVVESSQQEAFLHPILRTKYDRKVMTLRVQIFDSGSCKGNNIQVILQQLKRTVIKSMQSSTPITGT